MAKNNVFKMLYCIKATVRHFDGNTENTVALTVAMDQNSSEGVRVYRNLTHDWVNKLIDAAPTYVDAAGDEKEADLASLPDNTELKFDAFELEEGYTFSRTVPALFQRFVVNGQTVERLVNNVTGIRLKGSPLTEEDIVRRTMFFRLTAKDGDGEHRYGIPNRKSIQRQLAEYWVGSANYNFDDELDQLVDEEDNQE